MQPMRAIAPRLEALLFADSGKIDSAGKISLDGIFDRVYAAKGVALRFSVFLRAVCLVRTGQVIVVVTAPIGKEVGRQRIDTKEAKAPSFGAQNLAVIELPVVAFGAYRFEVFYDGRSIGAAELFIEEAGH